MPSGRYQASCQGPDTRRHFAPVTFELKMDAEHWLVDERRLITSGAWIAPKVRAEAAASPATGPCRFRSTRTPD